MRSEPVTTHSALNTHLNGEAAGMVGKTTPLKKRDRELDHGLLGYAFVLVLIAICLALFFLFLALTTIDGLFMLNAAFGRQ
jgi:hypothetical protein